MQRAKQSFSKLSHICELDIDNMPQHGRMTGIVCTVGPTCDDPEQLKLLIAEGVNICRLNVAHKTYEWHAETIKKIKLAANSLKLPATVAIGIDINGPRTRLGVVKKELGVELKMKKGDKIKLTTDTEYKDCGDKEVMYVNSDNLLSLATEGCQVYIADGPCSLKVLEKGENYLSCEVDNEGEIGNHYLCTVPRALPPAPVLTDKDKEDIQFALNNDVDILFISRVWSAELIQMVRKELGTKADQVRVIAKIQNYEGVRRYDEILAASDGIMVARGSLGIDITPEKVFLAQKMMIGRGNRVGKPIIIATQMLSSMITNPRPTRAEANDVANAILDGADCVMLGRETARGRHPIKAIQTLCAICKEAEAASFSNRMFSELTSYQPNRGILDETHTIAIAAVEAAEKSHATAIVVVTATGRSASLIAKYRPRCVIVAVTRDAHTARYLHLHRGILPIFHDDDRTAERWIEDVDQRIFRGISIVRERGYIKTNDVVVLVTGWQAGSGATNTVRLITVPDSQGMAPILQLSGSASSDSL